MNSIEFALNNLKDIIEKDSGLKLKRGINKEYPRIYFVNSPKDLRQDRYMVSIYFSKHAEDGDGELFLNIMEGGKAIEDIPVGQMPLGEAVELFIKHCNIGIEAE